MAYSLSQFQTEYDTETFPVRIGDRKLRFLKPRSIDRFINSENPLTDFPLWAKFWEASMVLAQYMAALPVDVHRRVLELGSGLGVVGIAAAVMGHTMILTEHNPDALNFLQANAVLNGCDPAMVRHLDWFRPELEGAFDLIIGSEIIYQEHIADALETLFRKHLAPGGRIVLTGKVRAAATLFLERLSPRFEVRTKKHTLSSQGESATVVLFEMRMK